MVRSIAYNDRTYKFLLKPPPTSWFIRKVVGKEKLTNHYSNIVGEISLKYVYEIAKMKKEADFDFANTELEGIVKSILGQIKGMGLRVTIDQDEPKPVSINLKT